MSLDNIQITPDIVQRLFKKSLVELKTTPIKNNLLNEDKWAFFGRNEKNILIIVNEKNAPFLADEDLNFLMGVLSACSLSMTDVALVNYFQKQEIKFAGLMEKFAPEKIIFLGTEPASLDFPLQFPHYQLQKYDHQIYLSAPALSVLAKDVQQKKLLWNCLKALFPVT